MKAKVYFSREITPEKVVALYRAVGRELPGKVAVKLHSGEQGNQNFLGPDFWRPMIETVHGTVVECNTAYEGERNTTEKHRRTMIKHGWSTNFDVDILDAEGPDLELAVPNGRSIQKNFVGKDIANYDSMLVLSHFKGHPMGGFGSPSAARPPTARPISTVPASPKRSGLPTTTASSTRWRTPPCPWRNISRTRPFSSTL